MKAASEQQFPARKGPEGNEAGRDGSGEHTHPAGNPIKSRPYFLIRVPARAFFCVLWFSLFSCLLNLGANFTSSVTMLASWVAMINAVIWLWIVMVMETVIQPDAECQSDDEEDEA